MCIMQRMNCEKHLNGFFASSIILKAMGAFILKGFVLRIGIKKEQSDALFFCV